MLEFFVPDRGFGAFDSGSGMEKLGSRIRDKIGSFTQEEIKVFHIFFVCRSGSGAV
jgi:hypothetical protein